MKINDHDKNIKKTTLKLWAVIMDFRLFSLDQTRNDTDYFTPNTSQLVFLRSGVNGVHLTMVHGHNEGLVVDILDRFDDFEV